jgi:ComF family protein
MLNRLIQALLPERCFLCGSLGETICTNCLGKIKIAHHGHCPLCGQASIFPQVCLCGESPVPFCTLFSLTPTLRKYLHLVKYKNQKNLLTLVPQLLGLPQLNSLALISKTKHVVIAPIPLHTSKEKERSFNQVNIIAQQISQVTGAPVKHLLARVKKTKPQAQTQHRKDRSKNTSGAFVCPDNFKIEADAHVVLIDDVITSGATMLAAAQALRKQGVHNVWCLGLAQEDWRGRGH